MRTTDIVVLSLTPWDDAWGRTQSLVAALLRDRADLRALFVEPSAQPWRDLVHGRRPVRGRALAPVTDVAGVPASQLWRFQATTWLPARVDRQAENRAADAVCTAASRVGFTRPVLWVVDPAGAVQLAETGWPALYDIAPDWLAAKRPAAVEERLLANEEFLLREVEEVVVCSPALARAKLIDREVTVVGNAADVELFRAPASRPADLPEVPVAVYAGAVSPDRLDLDLCVRTAAALREDGARLVLLGPQALTVDERDRLAHAGAVLLGVRPHRAMPGYLQHADVLVAPHLVNDFTASFDPISVYEYRVVGRPVVATPVLRQAPPGVAVAAGEEFVSAVRHAVAHPAPSSAPDGQVPPWAARARLLSAVLDRLHHARQPHDA